MSKHTPGPWRIGGVLLDNGVLTINANRFVIADAHNGVSLGDMLSGAMRRGGGRFDSNDATTQWANARLIAAAPDLLEALECLLPGLILDLRYADPDDDKEAMQSRITTVTEAIAKATGS